MDKELVTNLGEKLQKEDPTPEIFDEVQRKVLKCCILFPQAGFYNRLPPANVLSTTPQVYEMMLRDERFYPSFKQSPLYVRMLAELDMLKEPSYRGSDDGDGESFNGSPTGSLNLVRSMIPLLFGFHFNW